MEYNPAVHRRRSIRLRGYDYSQAGAYFVTICSQSRICFFGDIVDGDICLNDSGRMIQAIWDNLPIRFHHIRLDEFTVMPNHIHGIIILARRGESCIRPDIRPESNGPLGDHHSGDHILGDHKDRPYGTLPETENYTHRPHGTLSNTFGRIVQAFKSISTHKYIIGVKQSGWPPFPGKLWQRNYWEHIVRYESEMNRIREYIRNNPSQWELDKLNPGTG